MYNTRFQRHVPYLVKTQLAIGANAISCCWYPCLFLVFVALQLRCCGQLACCCAYRSGGLPCGQPPVSHCTGCYVYFTYACTFDGLCFCWRRVLCGFFNFSPVQNCFRWLIALAVFWFFMMSPDTSSKIEVFVSRWKFTGLELFDMVEKRMIVRRSVLQSAISIEAFYAIVRFQLKNPALAYTATFAGSFSAGWNERTRSASDCYCGEAGLSHGLELSFWFVIFIYLRAFAVQNIMFLIFTSDPFAPRKEFCMHS